MLILTWDLMALTWGLDLWALSSSWFRIYVSGLRLANVDLEPLGFACDVVWFETLRLIALLETCSSWIGFDLEHVGLNWELLILTGTCLDLAIIGIELFLI